MLKTFIKYKRLYLLCFSVAFIFVALNFFNYINRGIEDVWASKVQRYFYDEPTFSSYGTFFKLKNSYFTAAHVIDGALGKKPEFEPNDKSWTHAINGMDISISNIKSVLNYDFPIVQSGCNLIVIAYPARDMDYEVLEGVSYIQRAEANKQWIGIIENPNEPVVGGMSGGIVLASCRGEKYRPAGVLVTQNSKTDIDGDGQDEKSFDFVSIEYVLRDMRD